MHVGLGRSALAVCMLRHLLQEVKGAAGGGACARAKTSSLHQKTTIATDTYRSGSDLRMSSRNLSLQRLHATPVRSVHRRVGRTKTVPKAINTYIIFSGIFQQAVLVQYFICRAKALSTAGSMDGFVCLVKMRHFASITGTIPPAKKSPRSGARRW